MVLKLTHWAEIKLPICRHFECIFLNENVWISLKVSLKFLPKVWINNIPAMVQIMAWCWPGDKPSVSVPMMAHLLTHICITRPQWGKKWHICSKENPIVKIHIVISYIGKTWYRNRALIFTSCLILGEYSSGIYAIMYLIPVLAAN